MSSDNRSPVSPYLFDLFPVEGTAPLTGDADTLAASRQKARRDAKKVAKVAPQSVAVLTKLNAVGSVSGAVAKRYLTVKELATRWGVGVSTIWRWAHEARIPSPIAIGPRATRWEISDIETYERDRREVSI
jgi:prophage regulatory protein